MRIFFSCIGLALLVGCNDHAGDSSSSSAAPRRLVSDPASAIRSVLPDGWVVLGVKENEFPFYYSEGNGRAIELARIKEEGRVRKVSYDAKLWIMPADYQDGGGPKNTKLTQTWPPTLIATLADAKLYLWDGGAWGTIAEDILRVCLSSGKTEGQKKR
jgi:hypothetical protein